MNTGDQQTLGLYLHLMMVNGVAHLLKADQQFHFLASCLEHPLSAEEIAQHCGTQEKPTHLVMQGFETIGLVHQENGKFQLTEFGKISASNPKILGNFFWDYLPTYLTTGEPIIKMDVVQHQAEHYQAEVGMLGWMLRLVSEEAATLLGIGVQRKGLKILDVGAGSAVWSLAMVRRDRTSRVTALDWPEVLAVAQAQAKIEGMEGHLSILPGDFMKISLPQDSFDLAIVANVAHLQPPQRNQEMFARTHAALRSGGEIVVIDVLPGIKEGDVTRILYQIGLALRTEQGRVYSQEELQRGLAKAGFQGGQFMMLKSPPQILGMLVAKK